MVAVQLAAVLFVGTAMAEPQANVGVTAGMAGRGTQGDWWGHSGFHLGARGGRAVRPVRERGFRLGAVCGGNDIVRRRLCRGGVEWPVAGTFVLADCALCWGVCVERTGGGWEPGASGQLFWGSRSYNFHGSYVLAAGLSLQGRYGLGDSEERTIIIAAHLDGEVLSLPLVLLYQVVAGPSAE